MHRQPHRARLVGEAAGHCLADPPGGVRRELEVATPVELLDRADEADGALLDQIQEAEALAAVLLRDRHHEPQVRLDHAALGLEIALLDALGELDLLDLREQGIAADLVEEALERVGRALEGDDALRDLALGDRGRLLDELDAVALELAIDVLELAGIELALGERLGDLDRAQRCRARCQNRSGAPAREALRDFRKESWCSVTPCHGRPLHGSSPRRHRCSQKMWLAQIVGLRHHVQRPPRSVAFPRGRGVSSFRQRYASGRSFDSPGRVIWRAFHPENTFRLTADHSFAMMDRISARDVFVPAIVGGAPAHPPFSRPGRRGADGSRGSSPRPAARTRRVPGAGFPRRNA